MSEGIRTRAGAGGAVTAADTGVTIVVSSLLAIAVAAQTGRWCAARRRRARRRGRVRNRAADVVSRAEVLAEVVSSLTLRPNDTTLVGTVHRECGLLLSTADEITHDALGLGIRRAVRDVRESLLLLDADVSRAAALFVPGGTRDPGKHRFAMRRIAEWTDEMLLAARLLVIVADLEPE